jgi:glutathione S-transferase
VQGVANAFYADATDLVLLEIDEDRVIPEIRYEMVPGQTDPYPHIYGPLNVDAVVAVRPYR